MNSDKPFQHLSDDELAVVHKISESFEATLRSSKPAQIELFVNQVPVNLRSDVFSDLLSIELEWLISNRKLPTEREYLEKYPDYKTEIVHCFEVEQVADSLVKLSSSDERATVGANEGQMIPPIVAGNILDDRYVILRLIGEGGMGSVFLADQLKPVKRQVAIKFIKAGMDSKSVQARFEIERQALALMDHPGIAKVFDGGKADNGLNYFVMEYVPGVPLTRFCDEKQLDVKSRLQLFVSVCYAVQHAHAKGIIHRDLKPGNILVVEADGRSRPKVIDFGVAKAIDQKLAGQSLAATAMIVGTPVYMSPEQADPKSMDIDIRTDVYALGVILYELLAGTPPHDSDSVPRGNILELLRLIRDVDSPRPSTKVKSSESLYKIAANRNIDPQKLGPLLKGELDWIALKAIEKDRNRRYETVAGLQRDIERYLAGEMVEARPPSRTYRMQKFVRRNRWEVITACLLGVVLLAGICGTSWGMITARKHEAAAQNELLEKEAALVREAQQRKFAEAITDFVERDFLALTSLEGRLEVDGQQSDINRDSTLRDLLDRATMKLDQRENLDPKIEARIRLIIGRSYLNLGVFQNAVDSLQRASELCFKGYGAEHSETVTAQLDLANAQLADGQVETAKATLTAIVPHTSVATKEQRLLWLSCRSLLAKTHRQLGEPAAAIELLNKTLVGFKEIYGDTDHRVLSNMYDLALALNQADQQAAALALLEETLVLQTKHLGVENPDVHASSSKIAELYCKVGRFQEALPLLQKSLQWSIDNYGPEDHNTLYAMARLGIVYRELGEFDLAIDIAERNLEIARKIFANEHPNISNALGDLAVTYKTAGRPIDALPLFGEMLERRKKENGLRHSSTLISTINFASCLKAVGDAQKAQELNLQALTLSQELHGEEHSLTVAIKQNLANGYWTEKKFELSIPLVEEVLAYREAKNGRKHIETMQAIANVGVNYRDAQRYQEAIVLLEEVYASVDAWPSLKYVGVELLEALIRAKEVEKANNLLATLTSNAKVAQSANRLESAAALTKLGNVLLRTEEYAKAVPLFEQALQIRSQAEPTDWRTMDTMASLGETFLRQSEFSKSEPLLKKAIEGMGAASEDSTKIQEKRRQEVIGLLIELLNLTNRSQEAARWGEEIK